MESKPNLKEIFADAPDTPVRRKLAWLEDRHALLYDQAIKVLEPRGSTQVQLESLKSIKVTQDILRKKRKEIDDQLEASDVKRRRVFDFLCERVLSTHQSNVSRSFMPPDAASAEQEQDQECLTPGAVANFPSPLSGPSRALSADRCLSSPSLPAQPPACLPARNVNTPPIVRISNGSPGNEQSNGTRPRFTSHYAAGSPSDCILTKGAPPVVSDPSVSLDYNSYGRTKREQAEEVVLPKRTRIDRISYAIAQLCLCGVEVIMAGCTSEESGSTKMIRCSSAWGAVLEAKRELDVIMTEPSRVKKPFPGWNGPTFEHFRTQRGLLSLYFHCITPIRGAGAARLATAIELGDYGLTTHLSNGEIIEFLVTDCEVLPDDYTLALNDDELSYLGSASKAQQPEPTSTSVGLNALTRSATNAPNPGSTASYAARRRRPYESSARPVRGQKLARSGDMLTVFFDCLLSYLRLVAFRDLSNAERMKHPRFNAVMKAFRKISRFAQTEIFPEVRHCWSTRAVPFNALATQRGHRSLICKIDDAMASITPPRDLLSRSRR